MKPKSNLNDGEELLGLYQDNSRWIDRLFSTASKRTVGFSTEINQFLPIVIGNLYITNQRVIFEDKAKAMLPIKANKTYFNNLECFKLFTNSI